MLFCLLPSPLALLLPSSPPPSQLPSTQKIIITMSSSSQYVRDLYAEAEEATAMDHLNDDMDDEEDDDGLGPDDRMDPYEDLEDEDLEDLNDIRTIMAEDRTTRRVKWQTLMN
jgi:hypothetical protein